MSTDRLSNVMRDARRIVVKVGSSLVTNEGRGLDERAIGEWARQLAELVRDGREVVMVSSGAIAEGMKRLGWSTRPKRLHELQAAAAIRKRNRAYGTHGANRANRANTTVRSAMFRATTRVAPTCLVSGMFYYGIIFCEALNRSLTAFRDDMGSFLQVE